MIQVGSLVRYHWQDVSLEGIVTVIEENWQNTGEAYANVRRTQKPPARLTGRPPDWLPLKKLELVEGAEPQTTTPAAPTPTPTSMDEAAELMVVALRENFDKIMERRKEEAKYVRMRNAVKQLVQHGFIEKKQLPPPLSPPPPELYVTGDERLSQVRMRLPSATAFAVQLAERLSLDSDRVEQAVQDLLGADQAPAPSGQEQEQDPKPKRVRTATWTDDMLRQAADHVLDRPVTDEDAVALGAVSRSALMQQLRTNRERLEAMGYMFTLGRSDRGGRPPIVIRKAPAAPAVE